MLASFGNFGLQSRSMSYETEAVLNISKKKVKLTKKMLIRIRQKISCVQLCLREIQLWNSAVQCWLLDLKTFIFSAVQRFLGTEQRRIGTEHFLNRADQRWMSLRPQPEFSSANHFFASKS